MRTSIGRRSPCSETARSPIFENGVDEYLKRNLDSGRLDFTDDVAAAVRGADVVLLAVGTPSTEDGSADLHHLEEAADTVADNADGYTVVVTKSTVPVGTNRALQQRVNARNPDADIDVRFQPGVFFARDGRYRISFIRTARSSAPNPSAPGR